jgi:hypothetical protein
LERTAKQACACVWGTSDSVAGDGALLKVDLPIVNQKAAQPSIGPNANAAEMKL